MDAGTTTKSGIECRVEEGPTEGLIMDPLRISSVISLVTKAMLAAGFEDTDQIAAVLGSVRAGLGAGVPLAEALAQWR